MDEALIELLMREPLLTEEEARAELGVAGRTSFRTSAGGKNDEISVISGPFRVARDGSPNRMARTRFRPAIS